jgi:la-related protein 1
MGLDNGYGRYPNGFPSAGTLPPINTFMGQTTGMHEFPASAHAMSAMPYTPYIDQYSLLGMVSMQL